MDFNKIAALFISLLKITWLSKLASRPFKIDNNKNVRGNNSSKGHEIVIDLFKFKKSKIAKFKKRINIGVGEKPSF